MNKITIYHNESCSKSCSALAALEESGKEYEVITYLADVPTVAELKAIVEKLQCRPHDLVRTNENIYQEKFKDMELTDEEWLVAMHENPILIQRPIVVDGNKATIVRTAATLDGLRLT